MKTKYHLGVECPACLSQALSRSEGYDLNPTGVAIDVWCVRCKKNWTEWYKIEQVTLNEEEEEDL